MKRINQLVAASFAVLTLASPGHAAAERSRPRVSGEILEYGIYVPADNDRKSGNAAEPSRESGSAAAAKSRLLRQTDRVPMKKGVVFGYKWRIKGLVPNAPAKVLCRIQHPRIVAPGGTAREIDDEFVRFIPNDGTYEIKSTWRVAEDYELVPGEYRIIIRHDDRVIAEKRFILLAK